MQVAPGSGNSQQEMNVQAQKSHTSLRLFRSLETCNILSLFVGLMIEVEKQLRICANLWLLGLLFGATEIGIRCSRTWRAALEFLFNIFRSMAAKRKKTAYLQVLPWRVARTRVYMQCIST